MSRTLAVTCGRSGRWVQEARMGGGRLGPEMLAEGKWGLPAARPQASAGT